MKCPKCKSFTKVIDTTTKDKEIRRRRICSEGHKFTTLEKKITSRDFGVVKRVLDLEKRVNKQLVNDSTLYELYDV